LGLSPERPRLGATERCVLPPERPRLGATERCVLPPERRGVALGREERLAPSLPLALRSRGALPDVPREGGDVTRRSDIFS